MPRLIEFRLLRQTDGVVAADGDLFHATTVNNWQALSIDADSDWPVFRVRGSGISGLVLSPGNPIVLPAPRGPKDYSTLEFFAAGQGPQLCVLGALEQWRGRIRIHEVEPRVVAERLRQKVVKNWYAAGVTAHYAPFKGRRRATFIKQMTAADAYTIEGIVPITGAASQAIPLDTGTASATGVAFKVIEGESFDEVGWNGGSGACDVVLE